MDYNEGHVPGDTGDNQYVYENIASTQSSRKRHRLFDTTVESEHEEGQKKQHVCHGDNDNIYRNDNDNILVGKDYNDNELQYTPVDMDMGVEDSVGIGVGVQQGDMEGESHETVTDVGSPSHTIQPVVKFTTTDMSIQHIPPISTTSCMKSYGSTTSALVSYKDIPTVTTAPSQAIIETGIDTRKTGLIFNPLIDVDAMPTVTVGYSGQRVGEGRASLSGSDHSSQEIAVSFHAM